MRMPYACADRLRTLNYEVFSYRYAFWHVFCLKWGFFHGISGCHTAFKGALPPSVMFFITICHGLYYNQSWAFGHARSGMPRVQTAQAALLPGVRLSHWAGVQPVLYAVRADDARLLRVAEVGRGDAAKHLVEVLAGLPTRHGQVVEEPVATVFGGSTWNVAVKVGNKHEGAAHQVHDIF